MKTSLAAAILGAVLILSAGTADAGYYKRHGTITGTTAITATIGTIATMGIVNISTAVIVAITTARWSRRGSSAGPCCWARC